jgi:hypothetical protein
MSRDYSKAHPAAQASKRNRSIHFTNGTSFAPTGITADEKRPPRREAFWSAVAETPLFHFADEESAAGQA